MSDLMLLGVLRMPFDTPTLELMQLQERCRQAADRIEADAERIESLQSEVDELRRGKIVAERKVNVLGDYATSRLCPDHNGKWERGRCVLCELESLQSRAEAAETRLDKITKLGIAAERKRDEWCERAHAEAHRGDDAEQERDVYRKALEAIRDGVPGPRLLATDTLMELSSPVVSGETAGEDGQEP